MTTETAHPVHPATGAILRHFDYEQVPQPQRYLGVLFHGLAHRMAADLDGPELTAGLRKLLEARDCCMRAALEPLADLALRSAAAEGDDDQDDEPGECPCQENRLYGTCGH